MKQGFTVRQGGTDVIGLETVSQTIGRMFESCRDRQRFAAEKPNKIGRFLPIYSSFASRVPENHLMIRQDRKYWQ
jgi:hypothetical protein